MIPNVLVIKSVIFSTGKVNSTIDPSDSANLVFIRDPFSASPIIFGSSLSRVGKSGAACPHVRIARA